MNYYEDSFIVQPPAQLVIPAKHKAKIIKCIDAIQELFGPGGKYWIKGKYHLSQDGVDKFCLVGASQKANGPYEGPARLAIALAIDERARLEHAANSENVIITFNDKEPTKWADVKKVLNRARKIVQQAPTKL